MERTSQKSVEREGVWDQRLEEGRRRDVALPIERDLPDVGEGGGKVLGCERVETIV